MKLNKINYHILFYQIIILLLGLLCIGCGKNDIVNEAVDNNSKNKYITETEDNESNRLTIMGLYQNPQILNAIGIFNKSHPNIKIIYKTFDEEIDPETSMATELISGNIPDIYAMDMNGLGRLTLKDCISKNMLEDIRPFVENDEELIEDDFNPYIFKNMLYEDKLYISCGSVTLHTVVVKKDKYSNELINKGNMSYTDFVNYLDKRNDKAAVFFSESSDDELIAFLNSSMDIFIDEKRQSCNLNSDNFIKMLELSNRGNCFPCDENSMKKLLEDDEVLCFETTCDIPQIQIAEFGFGKTNELNIIGYPEQGTLVSYNGALAMSSTCKDKEGAWEFMRILMTKEYGAQNYREIYYDIPIRKDVLDAYLEMYKHDDDYIDSFGNNNRGAVGRGLSIGDLSISVKPLSTEEEIYFYSIIENIGGNYGSNYKVNDLISEEAKDYFVGDKTAEEVAIILQDKINKYLSE